MNISDGTTREIINTTAEFVIAGCWLAIAGILWHSLRHVSRPRRVARCWLIKIMVLAAGTHALSAFGHLGNSAIDHVNLGLHTLYAVTLAIGAGILFHNLRP